MHASLKSLTAAATTVREAPPREKSFLKKWAIVEARKNEITNSIILKFSRKKCRPHLFCCQRYLTRTRYNCISSIFLFYPSPTTNGYIKLH